MKKHVLSTGGNALSCLFLSYPLVLAEIIERMKARRFLKIMLIFFLCTPLLHAQSLSEHHILSTDETGRTREYTARDFITLKPGFKYTALEGKTFTARIDERLLFPPTEGNYATPEGVLTTNPALGGIVGAVPAQFSVGPGGAASYSIPIEAPAGVNGMEPRISLVYNSQGGSGIAGWGWNLSGISAISRTGSTLYHDSKVSEVKLNNTDNLLLDGQRLILISGSNLTEGAAYRTEVETYCSITMKQLGGYLCFEVKTKDGMTFEYGSSTDAYATPAGSTVPYTWLLKKAADANGNYISYVYETSRTNGEFRLSRIDYGSNLAYTSPYALQLQFFYEDRPDKETYYIAGHKVMQSKRLCEIQAKTNMMTTTVYKLSYSHGGLYSQLAGIKKTTDGIGFNPTVVKWKDDDNSSEREYYEEYVSLPHAVEARPVFADFNGDGKRDFITVKDNKVKLYLCAKSYGSISFNKKCEFDIYGEDYKGLALADLNGDGLMDIITITNSQAGYRYNYYFFDGETFSNGGGNGYKGFNTAEKDNDYIIGDFNGDGKHEIMIKSTQKVYNEHGRGIAEGGIADWGEELLPSFPNNLDLIDFTGSGKTNICVRTGTTTRIYQLEGTRFVQIFTTPHVSKFHDVYPGDYNGDGKTDLFVIRANQGRPDGHEGYWLLSTGKSFVKKDLPSLETSPNTMKGFIGDFNLDGKTDFAAAEYYTKNNKKYFRFRVGINNGNGFTFSTHLSEYKIDTPLDWMYLDFADYDGDGRTEICFNRYADVWFASTLPDSFSPRVKSIKNGLGVECSISYGVITNGFPYVETPGRQVSFPLTKSLMPLYVVDSYSEGSNFYYYKYKNIRSHKQGKGFLGFEEVEVTDYQNNKAAATKYAYDPACCYVYPAQQLLTTLQGDTLSAVTYTNKINYIGGRRIQVYTKEQQSKDYLKNLSTAASIQSIDEYGNPLSVKTVQGSVSETKSMQYVQRGSWCPNKPAVVTTVRTGGGQHYARTVMYEYDDKGRLVKETTDPGDRNQVTAEYKDYDIFGHPLTTEHTASGSTRRTQTRYTASGRFVESETNHLNETTTYVWNEIDGWLMDIIDRTGTTMYTYDWNGRLIDTKYPDGTHETEVLQWAGPNNFGAAYYAYSEKSGSPPVYVWYNRLGQEIVRESFGLNGRKTSIFTEYQPDGKIKRVSAPVFGSTPESWDAVYTYDVYGRTQAVETPLGTTTYQYQGRTSSVSSPEGTQRTTLNDAGQTAASTVNGRSTVFTYYPSGLVKSAAPEGGRPIVMEYDLQGNRTKITDPDAGVIRSQYNGWGELEWTKQKVHASGDSVLTTHTYAPNGLLQSIKITGSRNETTRYTYDSRNRTAAVEIPGKHRQAFTYDQFDRITNVKEEIDGRTYSRTVEYDAFGRVRKEIYPSGYYVTNKYDRYGSLVEVKDQAGRSIWRPVEENARGQLTKAAKGNKETTYSYDSRGFPSKIYCPGIISLNCLYNNKGNLNIYSDDLCRSEQFLTYDDMNRLTSWYTINNIWGGRDHESEDHTITYNAEGNIRHKSDLGEVTMHYGENNRPHALTSISGMPRGFSSVDLNLSYTDFKKIESIDEGCGSYSLTYGVDGQRRKSHYMPLAGESEGSLTRYYIGSYEEEISPDGNVRKIHYLKDAVMIQNNGVDSLLYTYTDFLGSLTALVHENGSVVERYAYDPWGTRLNPDNWLEKDKRTRFCLNRGYTGHEHIDQFGIINMNGRVYDPLTAQFLSPDPYVQAPENWLNYNRYLYAYGNPLKYTDPSGEFLVIDSFIFGFLSGLFNPDKSAWEEAKLRAKNDLKIWGGLFITDPNKNFLERSWELFSRFSWQLPQTILGFGYTQARNLVGNVDRVDYFNGAVFSTQENAGIRNGVTLGNYINTNIHKEIGEDFMDFLLDEPMYMHEYGHYLDSQVYGLSYLYVIGIPSLLSAGTSHEVTKWKGRTLEKNLRLSSHDLRVYEMRANRRAKDYFGKHYGVNFDKYRIDGYVTEVPYSTKQLK